MPSAFSTRHPFCCKRRQPGRLPYNRETGRGLCLPNFLDGGAGILDNGSGS